jgi:uncharacterized flavoprotein (TIGR03862 family)
VSQERSVAIVGAGPAGLMAAEVLSSAGFSVDVYDAMPTPGRKFLMAGRGGLNLTHSEDQALFLSRFRQSDSLEIPSNLRHVLEQFGPTQLRAWADSLGAETFVGSSGRVFPKVMKAAPLLRAWLHRLQHQGVQLHLRHHWHDWGGGASYTSSAPHSLVFNSPEGLKCVQAKSVLFALGGGSWPKLGSDGRWQALFAKRAITLRPLRPSNCGFNVAWSPYLSARFAGEPLKQVNLTAICGATKRGDVVITQQGIEGGAVYAISANLRDAIQRDGQTTLSLDLVPGRSVSELQQLLSQPSGSRSWTNVLRTRCKLSALQLALIHECLSEEDRHSPRKLAAGLKALPLTLISPRPIEEAISTAGGIAFEAIDEYFQLIAMPGVFCAGEMLDWEAPTGGYLLTACMATGRAAGLGMVRYLRGM